MEAIILFSAILYQQPVISEVCSNPFNDISGEYIEIYNSDTETLDISGYSVTDGDALDYLLPWSGAFPQAGVVTETSIIPSGGFAVLLEEDYPNDPWLSFPDGTVILTTGDHSICNGLASSDPITLYAPSGSSQSDVVSTFGTPLQSEEWTNCDDDGLDSIPFDPGEGLSLGRYPITAPDSEPNWFVGEPGPGVSTEAPPDTFFISIDSLFLECNDPDPGSSNLLTAYVSCHGTVSPDSGWVVLYLDADGDSIPEPEEVLYSTEAWNLIPGETDTLAVIFISPERGCYPAVCSAPGTSCRIHFTTGGGINPVITELMANPLIEDQEEFIEVFYPGPGVFPLAGCSFTDGDAVDCIVSLNGQAYVGSEQAALILDPEYQGTLNIPPEVPLFTPANTTIGNGLTTDDPILIYSQGEPSLSTLLSTAGTPLLYEDPLMCDDDGLDNISFNPGDGYSMERILPLGPDAEFNWTQSELGGSPGTVESSEGWIDLATDSIFSEGNGSFKVILSNLGVSDAEGLCTAFWDLDGDVSPSSTEIFHQQTVPLAVGQTDTLEIHCPLPDSGLFVAAAEIKNSADTLTGNNTGYCTYVSENPSWPVITEVLCNPSNEDCDEFIELFFPGPGMADITLFSISDLDAVDQLTAPSNPFITPGSYALILDPEYSEGSMPYDIPAGAPIFYPANTTIGDGLSGTDPLLLLLDSIVVSTYGTPEIQTDNIPFDPGSDLSIERITPEHTDSEESWISSQTGPTPLLPPSGIMEGVDFSLVSANFLPPMGEKGTETQFEVKLCSAGTDTVSQGELSITITIDGNEIHSSSPIPPALGDTVSISAQWMGSEEETVATAELFCEHDVNESNNIAETIWNRPPSLCINEIFYHETEWIELFNGTDATIKLSDITFSDPSTCTTIPEGQLTPDEFLIITESADEFQYSWGTVNCPVIELSPWPSLNNSSDTLIVSEGFRALDMVPYTNSWGGNAAASIERRSQTEMGFISGNWGTCLCQATPGAPNSIVEASTNEFLSLTPSVFNPPNTPLRIEVNLPMQACDVTVKVFDVRGMELEKLYSSIVPGEVLILEWFGNNYPVGRYIVYADALCAGEHITDAQVVILARPL